MSQISPKKEFRCYRWYFSTPCKHTYKHHSRLFLLWLIAAFRSPRNRVHIHYHNKWRHHILPAQKDAGIFKIPQIREISKIVLLVHTGTLNIATKIAAKLGNAEFFYLFNLRPSFAQWRSRLLKVVNLYRPSSHRRSLLQLSASDSLLFYSHILIPLRQSEWFTTTATGQSSA